MSSLTRRLRRRLHQFAPALKVTGYGAPGVVKVELAGTPPGLYPVEALGLTFAGAEPPITHVQVMQRGVGRG